ncbi:MAG: hypothetical protein GC151_13260 [Betaproteobacteria bacterium]|nr:hypothetical protein [Betaproteobacteria bacterium]
MTIEHVSNTQQDRRSAFIRSLASASDDFPAPPTPTRQQLINAQNDLRRGRIRDAIDESDHIKAAARRLVDAAIEYRAGWLAQRQALDDHQGERFVPIKESTAQLFDVSVAYRAAWREMEVTMAEIEARKIKHGQSEFAIKRQLLGLGGSQLDAIIRMAKDLEVRVCEELLACDSDASDQDRRRDLRRAEARVLQVMGDAAALENDPSPVEMIIDKATKLAAVLDGIEAAVLGMQQGADHG